MQKALTAVRIKLQNAVDEIELQQARHPGNVIFTIEQLLGIIDKQQNTIEGQSKEIARLKRSG